MGGNSGFNLLLAELKAGIATDNENKHYIIKPGWLKIFQISYKSIAAIKGSEVIKMNANKV